MTENYDLNVKLLAVQDQIPGGLAKVLQLLEDAAVTRGSQSDLFMKGQEKEIEPAVDALREELAKAARTHDA